MNDDISVESSLGKKRKISIPNAPALPSFKPANTAELSNTTSNLYSGLSNQGSTCYLNSLLQSLFMTPEFRLNLLNWKYDADNHGDKADCIPYQLQKLFARLQLKVRPAEETKDLTKSFQWGSSEVFQQHDIQELCRKLFEAIEVTMVADDHNFLNELYEGTSVSTVKCQECNSLSEKWDKFLDLTLPITNEFDKIYNKSLTMALKNFLKPEMLNASNQYLCDKCNKKVDALKYVAFDKLPKILFLSLSRFEYDPYTDGRKKINDRVPFPLVLNLNNFMKDHADIKYDPTIDETDEECLFLHQESKESEQKTTSTSEGGGNCTQEDTSFDLQKYNDKIEEYSKEGPSVYELFSVVIHSGTAQGGHYYAYIKSFEDGCWYSFNDSSVHQISVSELRSVFGGSGNFTSRYNSSSTGYVLMYRQAKTWNGIQKIYSETKDALINEDLKKDIESDNLRIVEEDKRRKDKLNLMTLKVYYNEEHKEVVAKKTDSVGGFKRLIMKEFNLENKFDASDLRLRACNHYSGKLLEYYDDEDTTLDANSIMSCKSYSLQARDKVTGEFEKYEPDLINLKVFIWKDEFEGKDESDLTYDNIPISNQGTLENLKRRICELHHFDYFLTPLYIFRKIEIGRTNFSMVEMMKPGEDMSKEIFRCAIMDNTKLFIEVKVSFPFESRFQVILSDKLSYTTVRFNLPVSKKTVTVHDYKMDCEIEVKRTTTLKEVKDKMAEYLRLKSETFLLKKYNHNGNEVKNLSETIVDITNGVINVISLYVEVGTPLSEEDIKIKVHLAVYDYSTFKLFPYKQSEICSVIIKSSWTIKELKSFLVKEIKDKSSIQLDEDYVLVRESTTDRPAKVFQEEKTVKCYEFTDNKKVIVQEYTKDKLRFNDDQLQMMTRRWDAENWNLSEAFEFPIEKKTKLSELGEIISTYFPEVKPENVGIYRVINGFNLYMNDINKYEFTRIYEHLDSTIDKFPFFISGHGNLFVVKDCTQVVSEPSLDKLKFYCRPQMSDCTAIVVVPQTNVESLSGNIADMVKLYEGGNTKSITGANRTMRLKEKGIVIKVKKTQEENKNEEGNDNTKLKDENNGRTEYTNINQHTSNSGEGKKVEFNIEDFQFEDEPEEFGPLI